MVVGLGRLVVVVEGRAPGVVGRRPPAAGTSLGLDSAVAHAGRRCCHRV